jgi:hypothetical protein
LKIRLLGLVLISCLALTLAILPQNAALAKTCYDASKEPIPCPKSGQMLTQQARKNIPPSETPVPPTQTLVPTATYTPTSAPTFTPGPTDTPEPTATQAAALLIVPVRVPAQPNACDPRIWPATAGVGILLALTGVAAQVIRARSTTRAYPLESARSEYSTESKANLENLDVHLGRVDFTDGGGGQNPSPAGPIALTTTGLVLALGSGAGILNLIPCSAWIPAAGVGVAAGLATVMLPRVFGKVGMRPFFSGRIKVTGNEKLAGKMKDGFDEQK